VCAELAAERLIIRVVLRNDPELQESQIFECTEKGRIRDLIRGQHGAYEFTQRKMEETA
jgi:hypothetical protein